MPMLTASVRYFQALCPVFPPILKRFLISGEKKREEVWRRERKGGVLWK